MPYRLLLLFTLLSISLSGQQSPYQFTIMVGSQGSVSESLDRGPAASIGLERVSMLGLRTDFFIGAGLQYGSYSTGVEDQIPDFIIGQVAIDYFLTQTYTPRQLDAFLTVGLDYHLGNLKIRGALHPMLRLHSRIKAEDRLDFFPEGRPDILAVETAAPGERFSWMDGLERELRYDTPFQLQASLEVTTELTPGVAVGLGYRQGIFDYDLRNFAVDWTNPPDCDPSACIFTPYESGRSDLQAGFGYVALRLNL